MEGFESTAVQVVKERASCSHSQIANWIIYIISVLAGGIKKKRWRQEFPGWRQENGHEPWGTGLAGNWLGCNGRVNERNGLTATVDLSVDIPFSRSRALSGGDLGRVST